MNLLLDKQTVLMELTAWVKQLDSWQSCTNAELLKEPIQAGKWSSLEVISHIQFWDRYLIHDVLPALKDGKIYFPDHDSYNTKATEYAKSGKTGNEIMEETKVIRQHLVTLLSERSVEELTQPVDINETSHCPRTGTRYSMLYLAYEFVEHDGYHTRQVQSKIGE